MWYLKFRLKHKGCMYTPYTEKFGVADFAYPLGHVLKGNNTVHLSAIHVLQGPSHGIQQYLNYLRKHESVLSIEGFGNIFFTQVREQIYPDEYRAVYNPEIVYIAPIINGKDGYELWQVASWNREPLAHLVSLSKTSPIVIDFELLEFRKKIVHDVYIANLLPKLSPKQVDALRIAHENGYYQFPRKTDLNELAKKLNVSKATFQEHLRRAEAKIIPFLLQHKNQ